MVAKPSHALIAGGHTFRLKHSAADPKQHIESEPAGAAGILEQSIGWKNNFGKRTFGGHDLKRHQKARVDMRFPAQWSHDCTELFQTE